MAITTTIGITTFVGAGYLAYIAVRESSRLSRETGLSGADEISRAFKQSDDPRIDNILSHVKAAGICLIAAFAAFGYGWALQPAAEGAIAATAELRKTLDAPAAPVQQAPQRAEAPVPVTAPAPAKPQQMTHISQWRIERPGSEHGCSIGYIAWQVCMANAYELVDIPSATNFVRTSRTAVQELGKYCSPEEADRSYDLGNVMAQKAMKVFYRQMNTLNPAKLDKFCSNSIRCVAGKGCDDLL